MTTISSNRRKKFRPGVFISVFLLSLLVAAVFLFRAPLSSAVWAVLSPLMHMRLGVAASTGTFLDSLHPNQTLAEENAQLRAELASTTILLMDRNLLLKENAELKLRLGRHAETTPLLAAVLMAPPGVPYDTLIIDVGSKEGVKAGDLVAAGGNVYIGRVADAYDSTSRVVLFSSPDEKYQGLLKGSIPLSLIGQGGGSMHGEVPAGTEVAVGDSVLLPSITAEYIAKVISVGVHEGESFKSVYLELPVNPYSLRFVEVHTRP